MSKPSTVDSFKSLFASKDGKSGERASLPNPLIVGFIFTAMFLIAITFIVL